MSPIRRSLRVWSVHRCTFDILTASFFWEIYIPISNFCSVKQNWFCVVTCCAPTLKLNQAFCFQLDDLCFSCVPPSMTSGLCWVHPYYFILLYGSLASLRSSCVKRCLFCCSFWKLSVTFFFSLKFPLAEALLFLCCSFSVCSFFFKKKSILLDVCPYFKSPFFLLRSPVKSDSWCSLLLISPCFVFLSILHLTPAPSCLLRFGAALWLWFWGVVASSLDPSCIAPGPLLLCLCDLWPLTYVIPPCVSPHPLHPVLVACGPRGHTMLLCSLLARLHTPHTLPPLLPNHRLNPDDPPLSLPPQPWPVTNPGPLSCPPFGIGTHHRPSLRAAKVAKAAAAVANSSSSPVKELRDLSAMDAFRSRSISVSEHAVRRLEKSLLVTSKKKTTTATQTFFFLSLFFLPGMADGVSGHCHVGPLGGRWVVLLQGTPGAGVACQMEGLCVLGCDHTRAVLHSVLPWFAFACGVMQKTSENVWFFFSVWFWL